MITDSMTFKEIAAEIATEIPQITNRAMNKFLNKRYKREILKKAKPHQLYWFKELEITSQRNNLFIIHPFVLGRSKKEREIIRCLIIAKFFYKRKLYLAVREDECMKNSTSFTFYQGHFFERYNERFLNAPTLELSYKNISTYFKRNLHSFYIYGELWGKKDATIIGVNDGLCLGDYIAEGIFFARTFIRHDQALDFQIHFSEEARKVLASMQMQSLYKNAA